MLERAPAPAPAGAASSKARPAPPAAAAAASDAAARRPPLRAVESPPPSALDFDAEIEQVDFFLHRMLPEEASAMLDDLEQRFERDAAAVARIAEKRRALAQFREEAAEAVGIDEAAGALPTEGGAPGAARGPDPSGAPVAVVTGGGSADLSTHGDLGIAYKEMGLNDAAIAEFKLLTEDPAREVFALTMIGECLEAKGTLTDAVVRYKEALNCEAVTPAETLVLYHLLGSVFERIGDRSEALYFFEKVAKRDPRFQDVDRRIAALRMPAPKRSPSEAGRGSG
jgi:tetratricopeptide (TPR) repeat protein